MKRFFLITALAWLTGIFLLAGPSASAQQANLSITGIFNLPDTVYEGTPYNTISVEVQNQSVFNSFTGTLFILIRQDTLGAFITDTLISGQGVTILPGDSAVLTTTNYFFTPNAFKAGGNTVVVWPSANQTVTVDSLQEYFVFIPFNSVAWHQPDNHELFLMPNPAAGFLVLETRLKPERVRIFNLEGRLVYDQPFLFKRLNLDGILPGGYVLEARLANGKRIFRKFIRQ